MKFLNALWWLLLTFSSMIAFSQKDQPLRIGIAGLTHAHVHWVFASAKKENIEIVGIAEPNRSLAERFARQYNFPLEKMYSSLENLLQKEKPEAVAAFNSIAEHLAVVEACAPKRIHVMVEKPLAVSLDHAKRMQQLAEQHGIFLLTNYETTWYPSVQKAHQLMTDMGSGNAIRKLVIHDGHQGPKEIGVNKEFLDWLTDPEKNGAGALMDFGCYGADLSTWLMKGERPLSVTAITQQIKPETYPKVDDEATIVLTYPSSQTIIQASWNWPFSRKDMEVYLKSGIVVARDRLHVSYRMQEKDADTLLTLPERAAPYHDPFSFFRSVVRKEISLEKQDLSSLPVNMVVMEILEAAKESSKKGKTVWLKK